MLNSDSRLPAIILRLRSAGVSPEVLEAASRADDLKDDAAQHALRLVMAVGVDAMEDDSIARSLAISAATLASAPAEAILGKALPDFPDQLNAFTAELRSLDSAFQLLELLPPHHGYLADELAEALSAFGKEKVFQTPEDEVRLGLALFDIWDITADEGSGPEPSPLLSAITDSEILLGSIVARRAELLRAKGIHKDQLSYCYWTYLSEELDDDVGRNGPLMDRPGYVRSSEFSPFHLIALLDEFAHDRKDVELGKLPIMLEMAQCMFSNRLEFFRSGPGDEEHYQGREELFTPLGPREREESRAAAETLERYAQTPGDNHGSHKKAYQENCLTLAAIIRQELGEVLDPPDRTGWVQQKLAALD